MNALNGIQDANLHRFVNGCSQMACPIGSERQERQQKTPGRNRGRGVLRRATPRAFAQCAKQGLACQPSTLTVTVVALWALGALTVSKPPW